MGFAKLDANFAGSSLLAQGGLELAGFWAVLLSKKDKHGRIHDSLPKIAHDCYTTKDRVRELLDVLASPDPDSRTPANDGCRIRIDREPSWCITVLNHAKYRGETSTERVQKFREKKRCETVSDRCSGSVSASASVSGGGEGGLGGEDQVGEQLLHRSRVARERRFYAIVARLAELQPEKDPADIAREISSYTARDGREVVGAVRPETMSDARLDKSLEDGEAWIVKLEGERGEA